VGAAHAALHLADFHLGDDGPEQAHALHILAVQVFGAPRVGEHATVPVRERLHEPFVIAWTAGQPIVGQHHDA
jgi:hypothetical protein